MDHAPVKMPLCELIELAHRFEILSQPGRLEFGVDAPQIVAIESGIRANTPAQQPSAERAIEADILPYCLDNGIATLGYGALCRGLLSGRIRLDTAFDGDDLRRVDPKFQPPRLAQYLEAVHRLDELAKKRFHRRVVHLAVRWMLDQGISVALWGGRHPEQVRAALDVAGWSLDEAERQLIERIVNTAVTDPVGPEFMAPPQRAA